MRLITICAFICFSGHSATGQFLNDQQLEFISQNVIDIEVDTNYQNGKWLPVIEKLRDKRLIMLGEFNHGSREVFVARNEIIKAIHGQLDVDLILFESGMGEVGVIDIQMNDLPTSHLTNGFFGGWRTQEFRELMGFIKDQDISIGGFDVQRTGSNFTNYMQTQLGTSADFSVLEKRFGGIKGKLSNYRTVFDSVNTETEELIGQYEKLKSRIGENELAIITLANRVTYLRYMLEFTQTKDWNKRWKARDLAMAENIKWQLKRHSQAKKVIVIAHNFHISRFNEKEEVMGEFLSKEFDEEMYVLGVFGKEGSYHNNSGKPEQLSPPDEHELDIKHVIDHVASHVSFMAIPKQPIKGSEWLHVPIVVNDTFVDLSNSNHLVLSKCFDGLLFIDKISPPKR